MRTIVYVDGFNLYYRALRHTSHRWLDLSTLCQAALPSSVHIAKINYYTARVSGRRDPTTPKDQNTYLNALKTCPEIAIHFGNFQVVNKWMFLARPLSLRPTPVIPPFPIPDFACVSKTEEKGSDVNLGVHIVRDSLLNAFEHAVIVTNDTDLCEPLRIVAEEAKLPITLLTPVDQPAQSLAQYATHVRHLRPYLGVSQFPDPVYGAKGLIAKPAGW